MRCHRALRAPVRSTVLSRGAGRGKRWALFVLCLPCACVTPSRPEPRPGPRVTPDQATQRVLADYGISARIVRPWSAVKEKSGAGDKGVRIGLAGSPGVELVLDRDYWVLAVTKAGEQRISWVLNPKDEQSGLNIFVGEDARDRSDDSLAKDPGFTEITRRPGTVGREAVTWRRWSDENHLYSDCTVRLRAKSDPLKRTHRVKLIVTANTEERRVALEEHLDSLQLSFSASPGR
jgi:hypothetical protein